MTKIVVVEDQAVLARIYRDKFLAEGFDVEVASDGEQAIELVKRTMPDLILLDLMLPKIKGVDVLRTLRSLDSFKTTPILVFSNSSLPGTIEEARSAGATMILSKANTSPKQMVESVRDALAKGSVSSSSMAQAPSVSGGANRRSAPVTHNERILVAENNPEVSAMISLLLSRGGYKVVNASGQDHDLLFAEVANVDLVVTNRALCKESFSAFSQQLQQRHPGLPVIMYSMVATSEEAEEALRGGISKFLRTPEQLLDIVQISASLIPEAVRS